MLPARAGEKHSWFVFDLFAPQGHEIRRSEEPSPEQQQPVVDKRHRLVDKIFSRFDTTMFRSVLLEHSKPKRKEDPHGRP